MSSPQGIHLIIAGSRNLNPSIAQISALIFDLPDLVICGCCEGVDRAGFAWARHFSVPVEFFPAWPSQRTWALTVARPEEIVHQCPGVRMAAGLIRNRAMASRATKCLILRYELSSGSTSMRDICMDAEIPFTLKQFEIRHGVAVLV